MIPCSNLSPKNLYGNRLLRKALAVILMAYFLFTIQICASQVPVKPTDLIARPDTLIFYDYILIVEKYNSKGTYNKAQKEFSGLNGYGRVIFSCAARSTPFAPSYNLGNFKTPVLIPVELMVVDSIQNTAAEITLSDASMFQPTIRRGDKISLLLPSDSKIRKEYLTEFYINKLKPQRKFSGIRFNFSGVTAKNISKRPGVATVLGGLATFPSTQSLLEASFPLNIEGFILRVDSMTLFHNKTGAARATLELPKFIASGNQCAATTVNLGEIQLNPKCEFYKPMGDGYGVWSVANTGFDISGKGLIADFQSGMGTAPGASDKKWKGIILQTGRTARKDSLQFSNIGFIGAGYTYANAFIDKNGFSASLKNNNGYQYTTIQPLGYQIGFQSASLLISKNNIESGDLLKIVLKLPERSIRNKHGQPIEVKTEKFQVNDKLAVTGSFSAASLSGPTYCWGEFDLAGKETLTYGVKSPGSGLFFTPGMLRENFYPLQGDVFSGLSRTELNLTTLQVRDIHGLTLIGPDSIFIQSPDLPGTTVNYPMGIHVLSYKLIPTKEIISWVNVGFRGVNASLYTPYITNEKNVQSPQMIGDSSESFYQGGTSFVFTGIGHPNPKISPISYGSIDLQFVESSVFYSDVRGGLILSKPTDDTLKAKEIVFTSTAQISGGKIDLSNPAELSYWGLDMVQRPGYASGGVLSVKTGQIILTAAGFDEPRHFEEPFYVHWAELLANGKVGRVFFDYHTPGQQFDGFDFSPDAIKLSDYTTSANGFLQTGGKLFFPYFGETYMHIIDTYTPTLSGRPNYGRTVKISSDTTVANFYASEKKIHANWGESTAIFNFDIDYNNSAQFGFTGTGSSTLASIGGGSINSRIVLRSDHGCISFNETQDRNFRYQAATNITKINNIWGSVCIQENQVESISFGGSLTSSSNLLMVGVRSGQVAQLIVRETPVLSQFTIDGQVTLSIALSFDLLVNAHFSMIHNKSQNYTEGEVNGIFRTAAGVVLAGTSLEGEGQANWHISHGSGVNSYQSIQGSLEMEVMGTKMGAGGGLGLSAGFYFGMNAPRSEAWVIMGGDPRYQFNMNSLPNRLSGIYGFGTLRAGMWSYLFSGGYEVFAGLGGFLFPSGSPSGGIAVTLSSGNRAYALGNLGGRVYGDILGGFVSASAFFNLQLLAPMPYGFHGRIGLEGCVAWVACKSVTLSLGMNSNEGFYLD